LAWENEKEAKRRMKESEEADWLGKKRNRLKEQCKSQKSQMGLGKREIGWKENERVRRARLAWEKEKEAGSKMKNSEDPDCLGKKRRRLEKE
jgi:hypothetical protein